MATCVPPSPMGTWATYARWVVPRTTVPVATPYRRTHRAPTVLLSFPGPTCLRSRLLPISDVPISLHAPLFACGMSSRHTQRTSDFRSVGQRPPGPVGNADEAFPCGSKRRPDVGGERPTRTPRTDSRKPADEAPWGFLFRAPFRIADSIRRDRNFPYISFSPSPSRQHGRLLGRRVQPLPVGPQHLARDCLALRPLVGAPTRPCGLPLFRLRLSALRAVLAYPFGSVAPI